jgi:Bacterial type II and III secretion system protein
MNKIGATAVLISLLPLSGVLGQEAPPADASAPKAATKGETARRSQLSLRIQLTISRFEGEKKMGSLPFTIVTNAPDGGWTSLRLGVEIPVRVGSGEKDKDGKTSASYQYKNVGTNIDCRADTTSEDGRYRLDLKVEQSSLSPTAEKLTAWAADLPFFRSFNTSFHALLRDGQAGTYLVATDPVSGEIVRIDVGLTVVK